MEFSEILVNVFFYVFAAGAVAGAVAVAASRNIVRSAFALLAVLFSAAALYALMKADFIAAAQVLIYVGGILVLIIFAVMLTHRITDVKISNESAPGPAAFFGCLCLLLALVYMGVSYGKWQREGEEKSVKAGTVELKLRQYQADGRTGLAIGGSALEERVVVAVKVDRPPEGAQEVEVEAAMVPEWDKPVKGSAPLVDGEARVTLTGLLSDDKKISKKAKSEIHWRARIRGAVKELTPWTIEGDDSKVDFRVYRGVTEPAARALAGPYLFAFEVISVLLLASLIGAAYLARKEVTE